MKKLIALFLAAVICLNLVGCGNTSTDSDQTGDEGTNSSETGSDTTAVAIAEELEGYWVAENGTVLKLGEDFFMDSIVYSSFFCIWDNPVIEGDRLSLSSSDCTFVYKISRADDKLSLHFLTDESTVDADAYDELFSAVCCDFTVYPASAQHTVELTLDNWQDYFEFIPATNGPIKNSLGEFEDIDSSYWVFASKKDAHVIGVENGAAEVNLKDEYYCWYTYDFATGAFTQGQPAEDGEVSSNAYLEERTHDFNFWAGAKSNNVYGISESYAVAEPVKTKSSYSFLGSAYSNVEVTRIQGTLTVIG